MYSFDKLLDDIMELEYEERSILTDILNKRRIDEERVIIKNYADGISEEYESGQLERQTAKEAINELHQYMESNDE